MRSTESFEMSGSTDFYRAKVLSRQSTLTHNNLLRQLEETNQQ
jgi:hypothetical protein